MALSTPNFPRHLKIGVTILGIAFAITLGFFVDIVGRIQSVVTEEDEEDPFTAPAEPLYRPSDPPMTVKLFFQSTGETMLTVDEQTIFRSSELTNRARQILQKVIEGPATDGLIPTIPQGTEVEELFLSQDGLVLIDFSNALSANHPGGIQNEQATIYSIVNSLIYNLPEIKQVKILIGGTEKETLAGHCLLLLPLEMDLSITDVPPTEAESLVGLTVQ